MTSTAAAMALNPSVSPRGSEPPVAPALARAVIYEVGLRKWGELQTGADVDTRAYVGSRERDQQKLDNNKSYLKRA
jgi:hypothetical protein